MRAGAHALSLLSVPLNVHVLQALEDQPKSLVDLRRAVGSPPQTTMRGNLRSLTEMEVLNRRRQAEFPGSVDYEIGRAGRDLLGVAETLRTWLSRAPEQPLALGSIAAKSTVKALVEGWSSTIVRALAARSLSLTDLNRLIQALNYPSLERRLTALRLAGLIEARSGHGSRGTPYAPTAWLRQAVAPLAAAARWERRYLAPETTAPVGRIDFEAMLLLAAPLIKLPLEQSGACRLVVELQGADDQSLAGVVAEVGEGSIQSCVARLRGEAAAWVSGPSGAWLEAATQNETDRLEVGGDCALAISILDGLHLALFGAVQKA